MNQLAVLNKHLRLAWEANAKIKGVESRKKANAALVEFCGEVGAVRFPEPVGVPAPSVILAVPEAEGGVSLGGGVGSRVDGEMPVEAARKPEIYKGNPVLEPVTDSEWEVGEPGPGVYANEIEGDTHEPERDIPPAPAEMRDGFPIKATIIVSSRCINPKLLAGRLGDGRSVSIERGFRQWKVGDSVECELLRSGGQPLYRQLNTRT